MRPFTTAALAVLAASTASGVTASGITVPPPDPVPIYYRVSAFHVFWSYQNILDGKFDLAARDTGAIVAHCGGQIDYAKGSPPKDEPLYGKCQNVESGSDFAFAIGGYPGTNFLLWLNNTKTDTNGQKVLYEAKESFSEKSYSCDIKSQNGNSATCDQHPWSVIELQANTYDTNRKELRV